MTVNYHLHFSSHYPRKGAHKWPAPVSVIFSAPEIELTSHISVTQLYCPLPGRLQTSSETSNGRQWKRLNSYLFLKDGQSEKHREVWKRKRYKEPCQTDIAAVESKAGSNVQSLPLILLERSNGRGGGRWRRGAEERLVAVPQKAHVTGCFIEQAKRRQPLHSSPDSLVQGPQEETFGKIRAPSLERGKSMCAYTACETACAACLPICSCLCLSDVTLCLFYNWTF